MNLEDLKDKLGDEYSKLVAFVKGKDDAIAAAAEKDATNRAKFKEVANDRDGLRRKFEAVSEHFGIDDDTDLATLPKGKDAAAAAQQYEAKLKRMQREKDEAIAQRDEATGKHRSSLQRAAVAEAMGAHEFVARDIVETYVGNRLTWEGDDVFYKSDDGKLLPIKDAVAGIAKTRPELLKPTGTGGAGARQGNAGSGATKTMTRAEFEALAPIQRVEAAKAGVQLV